MEVEHLSKKETLVQEIVSKQVQGCRIWLDIR